MSCSKVYFTDFRSYHEEALTHKLQRLMDKAGLGQLNMEGKYVAIKMHFGELGNLAFLRPNWAKAVADYVKSNGGRPFLTDCNTLYVGSRKNALDHLDTAFENGFNLFSTGCQILIADGLKGTDDVLVPVDGDYIKQAKIGRAVMDADIIISLTHFKGHESTGFGGAIKNLGMGCGSRAGKMEMHSSGKPQVDQDRCVGCGECRRNCAHDAITIENHKAFIDHNKCVGCGRCIGACPRDATHPTGDNTNEVLNCKMAEYALAVVNHRPQFHVCLVQDVSPWLRLATVAMILQFYRILECLPPSMQLLLIKLVQMPVWRQHLSRKIRDWKKCPIWVKILSSTAIPLVNGEVSLFMVKKSVWVSAIMSSL